MGKGLANPIGTFWSCVMLLEHLGESAAGDRHPGAAGRSKLEALFLQYLRTGGFPGVAAMDERGLVGTLIYTDDSPALGKLGVLPADTGSCASVARTVRTLADRLRLFDDDARYLLILGGDAVERAQLLAQTVGAVRVAVALLRHVGDGGDFGAGEAGQRGADLRAQRAAFIFRDHVDEEVGGAVVPGRVKEDRGPGPRLATVLGADQFRATATWGVDVGRHADLLPLIPCGRVCLEVSGGRRCVPIAGRKADQHRPVLQYDGRLPADKSSVARIRLRLVHARPHEHAAALAMILSRPSALNHLHGWNSGMLSILRRQHGRSTAGGNSEQ